MAVLTYKKVNKEEKRWLNTERIDRFTYPIKEECKANFIVGSIDNRSV